MLTFRKKSSKREPAKRSETRNVSLAKDVTIDDFANASKSHARIKKSAANILEGNQDAEKNTENVWNDVEKIDEDTLLNMDQTTSKSNQRRGRKGKVSEEISQDEGIEYPLDVWFLISEYISPETVGKFARICKNSYYVTTTGKFWFHLYKYYYRFLPGLPQRLQPQCMVRTHGLRACVIRTLHYTYFPFKREVDDTHHLRQEHPHSLAKRQCSLMWHKEDKLRWYFFFKLREIPTKKSRSLTQKSNINSKKSEFLETWKDVAVNPEDGCKILRVTCHKYCMLPPVIGLILQTVSMNLMPGFKDYRLQLGFGTSDLPSTLTTQVILTDMIDYKILDWWSPYYPHEDEIRTIELPQSDSWDENLLNRIS